MMAKIEMTIEELQSMLSEQKRMVAEYITRNLSVYHWWGKEGVDTTKARDELKIQANQAGYPNDFEVLKKYVK